MLHSLLHFFVLAINDLFSANVLFTISAFVPFFFCFFYTYFNALCMLPLPHLLHFTCPELLAEQVKIILKLVSILLDRILATCRFACRCREWFVIVILAVISLSMNFIIT